MSAEQRSFHDPLESLIYWDATFTISAGVDTELFHTECDTFRQRLEAESVLSVVSDFLYNELAFFIIKNALYSEGQRAQKTWWQIYEAHPELVTAIMPEVNRKKAEVEVATLQLSITDAVKTRAFYIMEEYGLLPTDAYHIATGLESGVDAFATLDQDFLRVDGIIVYTCLNSI